MKKYVLMLTVILLGFILHSCNQQSTPGPQGPVGPTGTTEKQIRIPFYYWGVNTSYAADSSSKIVSDYTIIKFNIQNYPGADSVIFVANFHGDSAIACTIDLYDLTDSSKLNNSTLTSYYDNYQYFETGNIISSFPNKEITLGMYITFSGKSSTISTNIFDPSILIYQP